MCSARRVKYNWTHIQLLRALLAAAASFAFTIGSPLHAADDRIVLGRFHTSTPRLKFYNIIVCLVFQ